MKDKAYEKYLSINETPGTICTYKGDRYIVKYILVSTDRTHYSLDLESIEDAAKNRIVIMSAQEFLNDIQIFDIPDLAGMKACKVCSSSITTYYIVEEGSVKLTDQHVEFIAASLMIVSDTHLNLYAAGGRETYLKHSVEPMDLEECMEEMVSILREKVAGVCLSSHTSMDNWRLLYEVMSTRKPSTPEQDNEICGMVRSESHIAYYIGKKSTKQYLEGYILCDTEKYISVVGDRIIYSTEPQQVPISIDKNTPLSRREAEDAISDVLLTQIVDEERE